MPNYLFDIQEAGIHIVDHDGTDLPDVEAARLEAAITITQLAADSIPANGPQHFIGVKVRNANDAVVLKMTLAFDSVVYGDPATDLL